MLVVSCCLAVAEFGLTTVRLVAAFSFRFVVAVEIRIVETVPIIDMSLHTVFSAKGFFTVGTGPTHVTSLTTKGKVRIKSNVPRLHKLTSFHIFIVS